MAYVQFWKGPAANYNATNHSGGVYQCTDTGDTYIFGVLNSGGGGGVIGLVLDLENDFPGNSGMISTELFNKINQAITDGVPIFIKSNRGIKV